MQRKHPVWICLALAVATLAVYWPTRHHDFVNYDDSDYVTANAHVLGGLKWRTVTWALTSGEASNWHPLTWLSHALDCQLFGATAGAHHLVSAGFHTVNSLLVFLVLWQLTGAQWRSAVVAAFFALHPLHVESVAWVSERKDVLSAFFFLLTLSAYGTYAARGSRRHYALALLLFALGLMSKPMLVTLPFVLLLLDWWPLRRLRLATTAEEPKQSQPTAPAAAGAARRATARPRLRSSGVAPPSPVPTPASSSPASPPRRWRGLVMEKAPFFALSAASSIITFVAQRKGGAVSTALPLDGRLANAAVSYARYIAKTFWPTKLSVLYPHPGHWPWWQVLGASLALLGVFAAVALAARRRPYAAVGWLWFFGILVPVIGLVQVGVQSMADRYMYLPLAGLLIVVVWGLADAAAARPGARAFLGATSVLGLAACATVTMRQIDYWRDSEALFRHAVEVTDKNYLAYNNLGYYLSNHGRSAEGKEFYERSLAINPNYEDANNNLGFALAGQKRFAEAVPYYEAALRVRPQHPEVHNNLGNALSELGRMDEAIAHYQVTLSQNPEHADANNNLGIALAMKGQLDQAIHHFRVALRAKPNDAGTHSNLGNALAVQHKLSEAIGEYREALHLRPNDAQANNNLANALLQQGQADEAIRHYQEALRLNPDNPEAHANLARALLIQNQPQGASEHFQAALGLNPNNPEGHQGLADALLRQGRRDEAAAHYREALRLQPGLVEARKQLEALAQPR